MHLASQKRNWFEIKFMTVSQRHSFHLAFPVSQACAFRQVHSIATEPISR